MKKEIHPVYQECRVSCACGNSFITQSTQKEIRVGVCAQCHPFYSGKRGRVLILKGAGNGKNRGTLLLHRR